MGKISFEVELVDVSVESASAKMAAIETKVSEITGANLMGIRYNWEKTEEIPND